MNDDHHGYHETITRAYLHGVRAHLASRRAESLLTSVNALIASPVGGRDWPLRFCPRDRLFSVEARRAWLAPDLADLDQA